MHTAMLTEILREAAQKYLEENPEADINDALSAMAFLLVMQCIINDISRTETLKNVSRVYEIMDATKDCARGALN